MAFAYKLDRALHVLEAKHLYRQRGSKERLIGSDDDRDKILHKMSIDGWQVIFYNHIPDTQIDIAINNISKLLPTLTANMSKFLSQLYDSKLNKDQIATKIIGMLRDHLPSDFDTIERISNEVNPADYHTVRNDLNEANGRIVHRFANLLMSAFNIKASDMMSLAIANISDPFGIHQFIPDHNETALDNLKQFVLETVEYLPRALPELLKRMNEAVQDHQNRISLQTSRMQHIAELTRDVLVRIKALGIRRSAAVPIRIHLVETHPPSGYGIIKKAGDQSPGVQRVQFLFGVDKQRQGTHHVNLYVTSSDTDNNIKSVLAHEIGHVLFTINPDVQKLIAAMAHNKLGDVVTSYKTIAGKLSTLDNNLLGTGKPRAGKPRAGKPHAGKQNIGKTKTNKPAQFTAPTDYGRVDYIYPGSDEPAYNHISGNEWMAEMFKQLVMGKSLDKFHPMQIRLFKLAIATINGHPHAGMIYRDNRFTSPIEKSQRRHTDKKERSSNS